MIRRGSMKGQVKPPIERLKQLSIRGSFDVEHTRQVGFNCLSQIIPLKEKETGTVR